ncbi:MAG: GAF domain-containing protein [Proteobacteria bacterium]|nr:GAF domain-containing protein [Pseudomonadota bacterium]
MEKDLDIVNKFLERRLQQTDIQNILSTLDTTSREGFLSKITDVLVKLTALLEVSKKVSDTLELDILLDRMIAITTEAINTDRGTLFLNDKNTEELFSRIAQGNLKNEIRFPNHMGIAGAVFKSGEAIIINDAYADPRFNQEIDKKTGYRTRNILCAPIKTKHNEIIGVIQLLNKHDGDFWEDDLALLEAITSQASAALQNAQLFEEVQKAKAEEKQLLEITSAISSELKLQPLLVKIMETTTDILNADRSTLFLHDGKTNELWSQVAQGLEIREIRFPSHLGIAGSVFTKGETVNIPDAYKDPRFNQEVDKKTGYTTRSILCMPVKNKEGKTLGVVQVLNKKDGPFTKKDENRLRAFSAQASISIENAKLFDDVLNMKNYNESMLESLSNGVITLDEEKCIVKCNSAALKILNIEASYIIDKPAEEYFSDNNKWIIEHIDNLVKTGKPYLAMDAELFLPDGSRASINLMIVPLVNIKQVHIGSMLILEDITKEKRIKSTMARYMTKEVAEKLLETGDSILGGQAQVATILFSDIRSFTTISEKLGANETVGMLNEYFTRMVDSIFNYGGILDKYIGDAIMAVFGTPFTTPDDADHAVKAAIDMLRALRKFNLERAAAGKINIDIGIGVNTDEVVAGNIGSLRRMDYTVIGDGVNLASRLEGATKYYGTRILISEFTFRQLKDSYTYREVDRIQVKGKLKPVAVYGILDYHDDESFQNMGEVVKIYNEGIACYREYKWEDSIDRFRKALSLNEGDTLSRFYLERCQYFVKHPPDKEWDGVWVMKEK